MLSQAQRTTILELCTQGVSRRDGATWLAFFAAPRGALGTKRDDAAQIGLQHMASIRRKPLHAREKILSLWSDRNRRERYSFAPIEQSRTGKRSR